MPKNQNDCQIIVKQIRELLSKQSAALVAIDGCCASGKTTLAKHIQQEFLCNVIHMDDFYLPLDKREPDWQKIPAKNINFHALKEILFKIKSQEPYQISPYCCKAGSYDKVLYYEPKPLTVVEGAYSCHPLLNDFYDFRIFMNIASKKQKSRLLMRNGEDGYTRFKTIWIPLEREYFSQYNIQCQCDFIIDDDL